MTDEQTCSRRPAGKIHRLSGTFPGEPAQAALALQGPSRHPHCLQEARMQVSLEGVGVALGGSERGPRLGSCHAYPTEACSQGDGEAEAARGATFLPDPHLSAIQSPYRIKNKRLSEAKMTE